ncbi:MAG TPA: aminotransferase class I/II-fold pyridoxal phosphate-dependent enzyme [Bacteroidota bacterium]|nr:aminotransferase class I/II-fold pyridoxal phosphate-dependent enzyme [Bacteroidota bacterium]
MSTTDVYKGGENFDLRQVLLRGRALRLREKTSVLSGFLDQLNSQNENLCMRKVVSPADRVVVVIDPATHERRRMLMFGSNNYLGLANHPHVCAMARQAIRDYGAGVGGPPLLNGYTGLHRTLEERLAAFKGTDDALIFSSGYGANVGMVAGLMNPDDMVIYDAYSHASFCDGITLSGVQSHRFPHNDISRLRAILQGQRQNSTRDIFIGVEGVYSMDGDIAPLDGIADLASQFDAILLVDDAHGTGVMGPTGRGTPEHFGMEGKIDVVMGTFSKVFAATGGFVAASKPIIDYLRYFARSYMFSASLPPAVIATVLGGLDVIEREPGLRQRLHENVNYAVQGLRSIGIEVRPEAAIIPLRVPVGMNIRSMAYKFHSLGIFVNSVEYPAVPISQQRFRVSLMATHTREDIDNLVEAVERVWDEESVQAER